MQKKERGKMIRNVDGKNFIGLKGIYVLNNIYSKECEVNVIDFMMQFGFISEVGNVNWLLLKEFKINFLIVKVNL